MNQASSNRKSHRWLIVFCSLAVLVLIGVVAFRAFSGTGLESLPVMDYRESPRNFVGNRYSLEGRVDQLLGHREGVGRILLVRDTAGDRPLALFADADLAGFSPNPGQVFRFDLIVEGDGLLGIEAFRKL